jgi:NAD(P)-dependent dehydrogenase (short-subunit alcohol dehydrogenase family)
VSLAGERALKSFAPTAFAGRRVLITGAGSGIGRAAALAFAATGAELFLTGRRDEVLADTEQFIREAGHTAPIHRATCDIREPATVADLVSFCEDRGGVDTLINNAGANFLAPALAISPNGFATVIRTVLLGTYNVTRAFGEKMVERQFGRIISLAATNAHDGSPMMAHSGASKAGVISLMETLAVEWGPFNVTCNSVSPGPVDSPEANEILWPDQKTYDAVAGRAPLGGRMASPEDCALAVLYLASDAAAFVTATNLIVDGGHRLRAPVPMG